MKFFSKLSQLTDRIQQKEAFSNIDGYQDIKNIVMRALEPDENYNILFLGPPASSKSLFLQEIQNIRKDSLFFDASNTTNRILDVLEEKRPKIILADELDKMPTKFTNQLLGFLQDGHIKVDQQKNSYDFIIKGAKVFATANDINRLIVPLRSRFMKLFLPRYTELQFLDVSEKVLPKLSPSISRYIGVQVWKMEGDIRNVIAVGKLVRKEDVPSEIEMLVNTLFKYGSHVSGGASCPI